MNMPIDQILSDFKQELLGFVSKHIKDEDLAKDVHQEILIKIFMNYKSLNNKDSLKAWIYRIARNAITDHYRHVQTVALHPGHNAYINEPETSEDELIPCVRPFVSRLKPSYQQALELTDLGNNTQKELAQKMNMSYSGAKSTVQRARHQLRDLFNQCCLIESDTYGSILSVKRKPGCDCS